MLLRCPERAATPAPCTSPLWTQLTGNSSLSSRTTVSNESTCPAARSGHAMTFLPPTSSVLLFGGADGKIFFEDVFVLEPARYEGLSSRTGRMTTRSSRREGGEAAEQVPEDLKWKKLVVSLGSTFNAQSPRSPMFSSAPSNSASPRAIGSGVERRAPTFLHPGGGRDYHTMHYVQRSSEEENLRGMRILVLGNVVVASNEVDMQRGAGTQAEGGAGNDTMAFDGPTMRVEELKVRQPMLEAQWEARRLDRDSMWKPRARHAHSSVVVGGDQVFVFGGKDATSMTFFNDIFYYDAPLNQWVKPSVSPTGQLPQPRAFAGLTASDDGKTLFLFGGTDGRQEFGSLFLFDVMHSRWDSLVGATLGERPSCRINHSLTFAAPNHLVLFGGRRRSTRQNDLYIFNVDTRTWRLVPGGQTGESGSGSCSSQPAIDDKAPVGRTAHATVLYHAEPAGQDAVQKLIIFGGYAGSHHWLDDLYSLSLPQAVLMQSPPASRRSSSRSIAATQRTTRLSFRKSGTEARVALSAPHQPLQPQSSQSTQQEESVQLLALLDQSVLPVPAKEPLVPLQQQQTPQTFQPEQEPSHVTSQQPQSLPQRSPRVIPAGSTQEQPPSRESRRSDKAQRATSTTGSGILTDITNQTGTSSQQQEAAVSRALGSRSDTPLRDPKKKYKRRRLADDSQDSNNSNSASSNGSGELTTAQVGIQTTLLQLLQHQPRVEDVLTRILSMLTNEQTVRQQQTVNQETLMRVHSEEQSKLLEAAMRRNEALDGRLARCEAERASLHEKLMARETELYMHKHSLEAAIPPLNERVQAIEASHQQQLDVSRAIESKISAVHDFMDELRHVGGEGTEADDSPNRRLGCLDDSLATQPTPSPPKPLLYPQRVVSALEEKIRVMQSEKDALEEQFKAMAEKLKMVEAREAQARQFFSSWCQADTLPASQGTALSTPGKASKLTGLDTLANRAES
ncbi:Actin-fragmin kinase [Phytophthora citrophthora]|uniref:Actin-fragmin kinase n=1 Tax=Phytophthora citrophthora TaxID=4793 RepID=A0AAD9G3J1_9STRA|nr:Actin-fragmin kinase [Phytophthora citrophthora]